MKRSYRIISTVCLCLVLGIGAFACGPQPPPPEPAPPPAEPPPPPVIQAIKVQLEMLAPQDQLGQQV